MEKIVDRNGGMWVARPAPERHRRQRLWVKQATSYKNSGERACDRLGHRITSERHVLRKARGISLDNRVATQHHEQCTSSTRFVAIGFGKLLIDGGPELRAIDAGRQRHDPLCNKI